MTEEILASIKEHLDFCEKELKKKCSQTKIRKKKLFNREIERHCQVKLPKDDEK